MTVTPSAPAAIQAKGRRLPGVVAAILITLVGALWMAGGAFAADDNASCNGILVSSAAGQPGVIAELTIYYHGIVKDLGFPPGVVVDAPGGHLHAGSIDACLEGLGG